MIFAQLESAKGLSCVGTSQKARASRVRNVLRALIFPSNKKPTREDELGNLLAFSRKILTLKKLTLKNALIFVLMRTHVGRAGIALALISRPAPGASVRLRAPCGDPSLSREPQRNGSQGPS